MRVRGRLEGRGDFEGTDLGVADGVGVVIDVDAFDVGLAFLEVEMFDVMLLAAVNVDGFFMEENQGAGEIHFADDRGLAGDVDDHEIIAGHGAQTDGVGRVGFLRPVIIFSRQMQITSFGEARANIEEIDIAEFIVGRYRQFKRSAFQMVDEDFEVVRLDESVLRGVAEKIVRVANDELIERRRRSHQHGAGASAAAAGTAGALPSGGDGARVSSHDDGIERTYIDAKLEGARRNHAPDFSIAQAAFDFAAFVGQITSAVAANRFGFSWKLRIRLLQVGEKDFRLQARIGEDHGLQIAFQKFLGHAGGFIDVAAADAQGAVHDGRIVENESFFRGGRAIRIEDFDFGLKKAGSEVAGVGDGCGAADEIRIAAVEASDATKAAEDVAEVAAEDAAVGVQLVEHDVAEAFEEARPARVMREDPGVQHVRVGQDDVAFFANGFAGVSGSVAVISKNSEAAVETLVEVVKFSELVLREGFGGKEVQSSRIRIFECRV